MRNRYEESGLFKAKRTIWNCIILYLEQAKATEYTREQIEWGVRSLRFALLEKTNGLLDIVGNPFVFSSYKIASISDFKRIIISL